MDAALLGHDSAKAALDIACWDILGKATGLPVCELLGGRTDVQLPRISSVSLKDPETMRSEVAEHRALGYKGCSVKIGNDPASDVECIKSHGRQATWGVLPA